MLEDVLFIMSPWLHIVILGDTNVRIGHDRSGFELILGLHSLSEERLDNDVLLEFQQEFASTWTIFKRYLVLAQKLPLVYILISIKSQCSLGSYSSSETLE